MFNRKMAIYWFISFLLASYFLTLKNFRSESNDSNYYNELVVRYHNQDWKTVFTPKWGENIYGFDPSTYMRDQLPGQTLMGIALTKMGVPATHALYILEMAFQILSIFLFVQIAQYFWEQKKATILFYSLLLIPMAFSYNIRANHESGIMFCSLLALYSGLKMGHSSKWIILAALASFGLLWIKGPFFIFGFILMTIGYFYSQEKNKSSLTLLAAYFLSIVFILISAICFELVTRKLTGTSFFLEFWSIQIQQRAIGLTQKHHFIIQKMINFYYYFSHYLAYALPWSLLLIIFIIKNLKTSAFFKNCFTFIKSPLSQCMLSAAMSFCLLFSLSDRVAGRYTFPGYYMFTAWVVLFLYDQSLTFKAIHEKLVKKGLHFIVPGLWLLAFGLHFLKKHA